MTASKKIEKTVVLLFLIGVLSLMLMGCQSQSTSEAPATTNETTEAAADTPVNAEPSQGYQTIDAKTGKAMMDQQEVLLIDVRTQEEFNEGHIPNAVLLPVDSLETLAPEALPDKEATVIVYCRSGNRSATASALLIEMGYTSVFDMGGIIDWPYEIVKP